MKGAEKIFIHGEEIARAKDVEHVRQDLSNTIYQEDANIRNELNQRIDAIPVINPQDLVDTGFDYSYEDPSYVSPVTITVESFGDGFRFDLGDDGYYTNTNQNVDASYSMCKIIINNSSDTNQNLSFKVYQQSENMYDFGMFSELNTDLIADVNDVSTNVAKVFQQLEGETDYSINVPAGESYITVKYKKDGSASNGSDTFKFKLNASSIVTGKRHMATKEEVEEKINQAVSAVYRYKGTVANEASLPIDATIGDVYNCEDTGNNFAWDGNRWDKLAGTIDLSNYYTKSEADASATSIANARAEAIVDERITELGTNDLLHYIGHFNSFENLPSTGQTSETPLSGGTIALSNPNFNNFRYSENPNKSDRMLTSYNTFKRYYESVKETYGEYFVVFTGVGYDSPDSIGFITNYPEQLFFNAFGSSYINGEIAAIYDSSKPVYLVKFDKGGSAPSISKVIEANCFLVGNEGSGYTSSGHDNSFKALEGSVAWTVLWLNTTLKYKSFNNKSLSITKDNKTMIYSGNNTIMSYDINNMPVSITYESAAKENDLATVGELNLLYRCTAAPAWEQWSKAAVTKEYVDKAIADALATLNGA